MQGSIVYSSTGTGFSVDNTPWYVGSGNPPKTSKNIIINEVLPSPQSIYTSEFAELYNPSSADVDISGYVIDDASSGVGAPHTIAAGTVIPANGYFIWNTNSYFNNAGDDVRLLDKSGIEIDKYTYGNSAYDKSWIRLPNGGTWQSTISSSQHQQQQTTKINKGR